MVSVSSSSRRAESSKDADRDAESKVPLFADDEAEFVAPPRQSSPLPIRQLVVICLMRLTEPVCFVLLLPFVNEMIEYVGVTDDPQQVGYYSGMVEASFALAQCFTVLWWGRLSDRIGRRPVLLLGMTGLVGATVLFGFSRSLGAMLLARGLQGALNGNVAVLKSVMGEITNSKNRAQAFALLPLTWSIGSSIAPILGGFASRPAERYPSLFGHIQLLIDYPYLLPCLLGASVAFLGVIFGLFFLEETLESKRKAKAIDKELELSPPPSAVSPVAPMSFSEPLADQHTIRYIMMLPRVRAVLLNLAFLNWTIMSIEAVFVLWLYTPVKDGGVGYDGRQIGLVLFANAIMSIIFNVVVFPHYLVPRFGTLNVHLFCMWLYIPQIVLFPVIHNVAVSKQPGLVFLGIAAMLVLRTSAGLVWPSNMILVNLASPSKASLGTVNGLAQLVSSAFRTIGPVFATALFALTMSKGWLGGYLIWVFQFTLVVLWIILGWGIRNHDFNDDEDI